MDDKDMRLKQGVVEAVLGRFRERRPEQAVRVLLAACGSRGLTNCRGLYGCRDVGTYRPPAGGTHGAGSVGGTSDLPVEIQNLDAVPSVQELYIGEQMHVLVHAGCSGYLHLFNFGTSGSPAKLFPLRADDAQQVRAGRWTYLSDRFTRQRVAYEEQGPVTPWPERLLAVVTRENKNVKPGDLYPDWERYDAPQVARSRGVGDDEWDVDRAGEWFWDLPEQDWQWGLLEVPVKERK